ncbi:MAG: hypothetical protein R3F02_01555 [Thiolinea sp.]
MKKPDNHDSKRRAFLRGGAMLGAGATLVATAPGIAAPLTAEPEAEQKAEPEHKGYQLTAHVAAYYRNAAS